MIRCKILFLIHRSKSLWQRMNTKNDRFLSVIKYLLKMCWQSKILGTLLLCQNCQRILRPRYNIFTKTHLRQIFTKSLYATNIFQQSTTSFIRDYIFSKPSFGVSRVLRAGVNYCWTVAHRELNNDCKTEVLHTGLLLSDGDSNCHHVISTS